MSSHCGPWCSASPVGHCLSVLVSYNPLPWSVRASEPLSLLFPLPRMSSQIPAWLVSLKSLYSNVTLSLRLLPWQRSHEPSPQYILFHLPASFLLPTIYHHLPCYCLLPLSRKKVLGGRNNCLLCLLLNPQSLIRCLTHSRCSVYLLVRWMVYL